MPQNLMNIHPLSRRSEMVFSIASELARTGSRSQIEPLDLVKAIVAIGSGVAWYLLAELGLNLDLPDIAAVERAREEEHPTKWLSLKFKANEALMQADIETHHRSLTYISTECLLLGLLNVEDTKVNAYLEQADTSAHAVRQILCPALDAC